MIYVTINTIIFNDEKEFENDKEFGAWMATTFSGADLVFREGQGIRCYWHRVSQSFILVRGKM